MVLLNLSFTYLKLEQPPKALRYGEQALTIDHRNAKALFRCGQVSRVQGAVERACGRYPGRPACKGTPMPGIRRPVTL